MPTIRPFRGLRPAQHVAEQVIAPPYDVINTEEARAFAADKPLNFLHVSRAEIDLPPGTPPFSESVYETAARNFRALISKQVLVRDATEKFYVYGLAADGRQQTGLVGVVSVADYLAERIRKHEHTRPDKENDRIAHMQALNAQTGPTMLVYREIPGAQALLDDVCGERPDYDSLELGGVKHSLWSVEDPNLNGELAKAFTDAPEFYIADGHHRSAAAAGVAERREGKGSGACQYFLAVVFPHTQMRILDYNRVVRDLGDLSTDRFLERVRQSFTVERYDEPVRPRTAGEFGLYLDRTWYRLTLRPETNSEDPIERLDVRRLETHLLNPILGITDLRTDPRIDFVGGGRGLAELERRVDSGGMRAAFSLYPTSLKDLMAVADTGAVMPPKSTWFEPKLADGLIAHVLD